MNAAQRLNKSISGKKSSKPEREGALKRNNVYTTDAVRDWAGRIHAGPGGVKLNEKFMLVAMSASCNPRGMCEIPVRYLADYIGVGIRQAQRIIKRLVQYELVSAEGLLLEHRPVDVVRKFQLHTTIDPDAWNPKDGSEVPLMRHMREAFQARLRAALAEKKLSDIEYINLSQVHLVVVRSKQLDFVSPDVEVTNTAYRYKKVLLELASTMSKSEVLRLHMIPKKGYRE
jgi:hypothetical protein